MFTDTDPDLSRGKVNRHSQVAHESIRARKPSMRDSVCALIDGAGRTGQTLEQVCAVLHKLPHQLSGRITELKKLGRIAEKPRAEGVTAAKHECAIYVTPRHLATEGGAILSRLEDPKAVV